MPDLVSRLHLPGVLGKIRLNIYLRVLLLAIGSALTFCAFFLNWYSSDYSPPADFTTINGHQVPPFHYTFNGFDQAVYGHLNGATNIWTSIVWLFVTVHVLFLLSLIYFLLARSHTLENLLSGKSSAASKFMYSVFTLAIPRILNFSQIFTYLFTLYTLLSTHAGLDFIKQHFIDNYGSGAQTDQAAQYLSTRIDDGFWLVILGLAISAVAVYTGISDPKAVRAARAKLAAANQSLAQSPQDVALLKQKAQALKNLYQYKQAIPVYDQIIALTPNDAVAWWHKARLLEITAQHQAALPVIDRSLALNPTDPDAWAMKATILNDIGVDTKDATQRARLYRDALATGDQALALDSQNALAWGMKGTTLMNLGDKPGAIAALERAVALNPTEANRRGLVRARGYSHLEKSVSGVDQFFRVVGGVIGVPLGGYLGADFVYILAIIYDINFLLFLVLTFLGGVGGAILGGYLGGAVGRYLRGQA